jgi:hypothetical protein
MKAFLVLPWNLYLQWSMFFLPMFLIFLALGVIFLLYYRRHAIPGKKTYYVFCGIGILSIIQAFLWLGMLNLMVIVDLIRN